MDKSTIKTIAVGVAGFLIIVALKFAWSTFVTDVDNLKKTVAKQNHKMLHEINELRLLHDLPALDTMHDKEGK